MADVHIPQLIGELLRVSPPLRGVDETVQAVFTAIAAHLERGESINIRGFGTFYVSVRKAHRAATPEEWAEFGAATRDLPEVRVTRFRPAEGLHLRLQPRPKTSGQ